MKIVIDLDNTLLDATTPHLKYYNLASGQSFTEQDVHDYYIYRLYDWDQEKRDSIYNQYGHHIHWESVPYPMAAEVWNQIAAQHQITIMTARPTRFRQVTIDWLKQHGFEYHHITFTDRKYQEFIHLGADVLVEDAPHYALEFSDNQLPVILFHQQYNATVDSQYIYRAHHWLEVKQHIDSLNQSGMDATSC